MIRPKYLILALARARFKWRSHSRLFFSIYSRFYLTQREGRERGGKRRNKKRSSRNPGLEYLFLYGTLVWKSCLEILV